MSEQNNNPTTQTAREETPSERHAREGKEERLALALVKAGDTVYKTSGWSIYPVTVTRVTSERIVIGSTQYKRENGAEHARYSRDYIYPAIPRIVARYEAQEKAKADKLETERRRDYLAEHTDKLAGNTLHTVYHVGRYALLMWAHEYDEGGYRFALYGKNADEVYKQINAMQGYTSLADALAALAGAIVTTDAERLALVRLVTGRE